VRRQRWGREDGGQAGSCERRGPPQEPSMLFRSFPIVSEGLDEGRPSCGYCACTRHLVYPRFATSSLSCLRRCERGAQAGCKFRAGYKHALLPAVSKQLETGEPPRCVGLSKQGTVWAIRNNCRVIELMGRWRPPSACTAARQFTLAAGREAIPGSWRSDVRWYTCVNTSFD
jgi:hypothetical protein